MPVDMQRLGIERHVGEQHVVHLCDRAGVPVLIGPTDLEVLEVKTTSLVPLDRFHRQFLQKSLRNRG
jgi:hypothetical protein